MGILSVDDLAMRTLISFRFSRLEGWMMNCECMQIDVFDLWHCNQED